MTEQRRLAAILVADVVGYSKLVGSDETGTLTRLAALRREVIEPAIAKHAGRLFKAVGDGFLVEFASAVQAVTAARALQEANTSGTLLLRIGIHVGDVVVEGDDLMGDGVNIAARIEGVADVGGVAISRAVHEQVRDKLDVSFVDKGAVSLKNLARPVQVFALDGTTSSSAIEAAPTLPLPDKPSIAVLPFQNMSGDPEQEYFADGIVEDIITALSRFKSLIVIARNSSFTYKGKAVDIKRVGRELGVRYVLEGSVRKGGGKVRITGQLIDSETGAHLWADRFDGALEDIFDLQDQVTGNVVAAVAPRITQAEIERAKRKPTENLSAYDYYLRGAALFERRTNEAHREARLLFEQAIELDPNFSTPYAMIVRCHSTAKLHGWSLDNDHAEIEVRRLAERISDLANDDALALSSTGFALAWVCRDYDAAVAFVDRAIAVNSNLAHAWMNRAQISSFRGEHEVAIEQFAHALRLSPIGPDYYLVQGYLAFSHFMLGHYEEAQRAGAEAASHQPNWLSGHMVLSAAHAMAGSIQSARNSLNQVRRLSPSLRPSTIENSWSYRRPEDRAHLAEGLRLAGLPE